MNFNQLFKTVRIKNINIAFESKEHITDRKCEYRFIEILHKQ